MPTLVCHFRYLQTHLYDQTKYFAISIYSKTFTWNDTLYACLNSETNFYEKEY